MKEPIELDIKQIEALLHRAKAVLSPDDYDIIKAMADTIYLLSQSLDKKSTPSKPRGHGRKPAVEYTGAAKVQIQLDALQPGDHCPGCVKGKVYELKEPKRIVRITGNAPISGKIYELQRLRCNLCGEIFTADTPPGVGQEKYDARSSAVIAVLKYGTGMPFNRIENLQQSLGIPLSASTQFEIVEKVADMFEPVYTALIQKAAQGDVIYNDDTTMKVLALMQEENPSRKGIFTTGILSTTETHKIALFVTGRQHAGENLGDLLKQRADRGPPIQMCDALSRNVPKDFATLLANCLAHGRRQFVDLLDNFPESCRYVLDTLAKVYQYDQIAKERNMDPDARLLFHQENSAPLMDKLNEWFHGQLDQKIVEPNSGLGQAINYMLNHWVALTLFLRQPGAPLDNNICERALKKAILHRKNALFYKTLNGARIGDLYMSLIHTCGLTGVNPIEYLTVLQENAAKMAQNPQNWLPWNYTAALPLEPR